VETKQNLSAPEMLNYISKFSESDGHGLMAALAIFSHGKDGMIYGDDGKSKCSIQEVINQLHSGNVKNSPKVSKYTNDKDHHYQLLSYQIIVLLCHPFVE